MGAGGAQAQGQQILSEKDVRPQAMIKESKKRI